MLSALILICGLVSDFSHANSDLIPGGDGRCNGPLERVPVVTSGGRPVATALTAYELAPLTP